MTNQTAFNRVVRHLRKQGEKSIANINHVDKCRYRGPRGLKCAIGCLIPDKEYRPSLEGLVASAIVNRCPTIKNLDVKLLDGLQFIHDNIPICSWESELEIIAKVYKLKFPNIKAQ